MPALHPRAATVLLLTATMGLLGTTAFAQQPAPVSGVDASVHPGDDFFAYANGQWLKATEIPAGRARWTVRDEIQALTRQQVASLLGDLAAGPTASPAARKVADYRAAFLDQNAIEARGLTPIQPLLKRIAVLRDKSDLARWLGSEMPADGDPMGFGGAQSAHLLGLAVDKGISGERFNAAFLVQGGLGLPDREHYLSDAAPMQALRGKYRDYLAQLWVLTGRRPEPQRIDAVIALETAIARSHATQEDSGKEENARNLWTRADFARQAPGMGWGAFFAAAGLARQDSLIVWQPSALKGAAALLAAQPLQVWKDYLHLRTVDRYAQVLPRAIADAAYALHGVAVAGQSASAPRAQQANAAVQRSLGDRVTRLYVERHFAAAHKARVQSIAAQVKAALRERVAVVHWLSPAGRQQAMAKLDAVYFGLGHADRWLDDADLQIRRDDAFGNQRRTAQWHTRRALAQLNQPVDPKRWVLPGHDIVAGLIFTQNAYNFPAGLLQAPKFDIAQSAEPDAFNFGAIGAIVGHELTHFIDTLGADYDLQGAKRRWWSAEDLARYQAATQPLVEQFSSYRPFPDTFPDVAVDGKASLVENLADLMGLTAAFEAYRRTLATHPRKDDAEYVKQQDQLFFIGFARSWRAKLSDDALRKQAATTHPPGTYRIATVRNFDAWYHAFEVRPGHRLWLEPKDRVQPWSAP
ncbi:MAG: M13-type metalloendopeptidase [Burkholderiaceae bacterium]